MPRGVPKAGFRKTKNWINNAKSKPTNTIVEFKTTRVESISEIEAKLADRFETLQVVAEATVSGANTAMIVSGPAGLGKSYTVERVVEQAEKTGSNVTYISGHVRPLALYRVLYNARFSGSIVVFDDSDSLFADEISLNLLKKACDTTERRILYWLSESLKNIEDEEGESIPEKFEFEGSVIFITNYDMDDLIRRGNKFAPHFQALISRSLYVDLEMKTKMDYIVRIKQVVAGGMLRDMGMSQQQENEIVDYITKHKDDMRELSLRMAIKLAKLIKIDPVNWKKRARHTCLMPSI